MSILPEDVAVRVTLGLGGNLDNPAHAMALALRTLDARADCQVASVSRLYRTPPWGKTDQSFFYNSCAALDTTLAPNALIDIDLLTYGDLQQSEPLLTIPHPRMVERGFVLMPLADFAANLVVSGRTVGEWLGEVDVEGIEVADESRDWWRTA